MDHVANYSDEVWRSLSSSSSTSSLSSAKSVLQLQDNYQPSIDPITYNNPSNSANNDLSYKLRILLANISEHKIVKAFVFLSFVFIFKELVLIFF